jgi:hypothetical protein
VDMMGCSGMPISNDYLGKKVNRERSYSSKVTNNVSLVVFGSEMVSKVGLRKPRLVAIFRGGFALSKGAAGTALGKSGRKRPSPVTHT